MASGSLDPTEVALVQRGGVLTEVHYGTLMEPLWNPYGTLMEPLEYDNMGGWNGGTEFMEFIGIPYWNHCC